MVGGITTQGDLTMKTLMTTTALILALGLPAVSIAQTETTAPAATTTTNPDAAGNFLAMRSMNQLLASDLIGHDVYARRTAMDMTATTPLPAGSARSALTADQLADMDNVGMISDLVLSDNGTVSAIVIGVGGFLGIGEQDVAVTMDQVSFAAKADDPAAMYVVINTTGDLLKTSPAFDRAGFASANAVDAVEGAATQTAADTAMSTERGMLTAPSMTRDGYNVVKMTDLSMDLLMGKQVYGLDDTSVGTVDDVIVDEAGAVQKVIIDFGGFLGMGTTQVALNFDELTILTNEGNADIRVYVDATKEQISAMPVYTATN
jgi:sporulation protein YlmC with PRC-barrel domain